jgi:outer membrane autotransporter protein
MKTKSKLIKNLLATASTMAVLMGSVQSASAVGNSTANANPARFNTSGEWSELAIVASNNTVKYTAGNAIVQADLALTGILIDANNTAGGVVNIALPAAQTLQISKVFDGGGGANTSNIKFTVDNNTLELNGNTANDYQLLSQILFNGKDSTVKLLLTTTSTVPAEFVAGVANAGHIYVADNSTLAGNIGAAGAINTITIGTGAAAKTLTLKNSAASTVKAKTLVFEHADSILAIDSTNDIVDIDITDSIVGTAITGLGKINVSVPGAKTITVNANVAGTVGTLAAPIKELNLTVGAGTGNAVFSTAVYAVTSTISGAGAAGIAEFKAGLNSKSLTYNAASTVKLDADSAITTTDFTDNNGTLKIADGKKLTGAVKSTGGANGTIEFLGSGEIAGAIGTKATDGAALIKVGIANKIVTLGGGEIFATSTTYQDEGTVNLNNNLTGNIDFNAKANATLNVGTAVNKLAGDIIAGAGGGKGKIEFKNAGALTVTGVVGSTGTVQQLKLSGDGDVIIAGQLKAAAIVFNNVDVSNILDLTTTAPNALGVVTTATKDKGVIKLGDDYTVAANIGVNLTELDQILLANNKTLTVNGGVDVYAKVASAIAHENKLTLSGVSTIYAVGTADKPLLKVNAGAGAATFKHSVYADQIAFSGANDLTFEAGTVKSTIDFLARNQQIILGDGVIVEGDVGSSNTADTGKIKFNGSGSVTGALGAANKLNLIDATGVAGKVVILAGPTLNATKIKFSGEGAINLNSVAVTTDVDFNDQEDAILIIGNGVTLTGNIDNTGAAANKGIVVLNGGAIVTGKIGDTRVLKSLEIGAGIVSLQEDTKAAALVFKAVGGKVTMTDTKDITVTSITSDAGGAAAGTLVLGSDTTLGNVATDANRLEAIEVPGGKTLTINQANGKVYANINGAGNLTITDGEVFLGVGTNGAKIGTINAGVGTTDATFNGGVFATTFNVTGAKTLNFTEGLTATTLGFGGANDGKVVISTGKTFDVTNITGTGAGLYGQLELQGVRTIAKDIGTNAVYLKSLTFSKDSVNTLNANVYAKTITATGAELVLAKNVTAGQAGGTLDLTGATLDLGSKTLTSASNITLNNATTLEIFATNNANGNIDNTDNNTAVTFDAVKVAFDGEEMLNIGDEITVFKGGAVPVLKNKGFIVTEDDVIKDLEVIVKDKSIILKVKQEKNLSTVLQNASEKSGKVLSPSAQQYLSQISTVSETATGQAKEYSNEVKLLARKDSDKLVEMIARVSQNPNSTQAVRGMTVAAVSAGVDASSTAVDNRTSSLEGSRFAANTGMSAGSEMSKMGAWLKGFGGKNSQKMRKGEPGYKAQTGGAVVGFDAALTDQLITGVAYTHAEADVKHRNAKAGDKTTAKTNLFTLYTSYDMGNSMFVQGAVNVGSSKVVSKDTKILLSGNATAVGKYDIFTYGMNAIMGYNFAAHNNLLITPMAGLNYQKFLESDYTETGAGNQNQKIFKRSYDKIVGKIGAKLAMPYDYKGYEVTPEVHGFINQDFKSKAARIESTMDGLGIVTSVKGAKPDATSYNLGLGISSKYGNSEWGVEYNAEMRSKFIGHQGSFKVRVNF